jgi:hypothetical protein
MQIFQKLYIIFPELIIINYAIIMKLPLAKLEIRLLWAWFIHGLSLTRPTIMAAFNPALLARMCVHMGSRPAGML